MKIVAECPSGSAECTGNVSFYLVMSPVSTVSVATAVLRSVSSVGPLAAYLKMVEMANVANSSLSEGSYWTTNGSAWNPAEPVLSGMASAVSTGTGTVEYLGST